MVKKYFVLLIFFLGIQLPVFADQPVQSTKKFALNNSQIIPLKSKAGRDYELVVIVPAGYAAHPEKKYPVLYFVDAYWDAPLLSSTYNNLSFDNEIPEFIMVGLSYPDGANYDNERRLDLTFTQLKGMETSTGGAFTFLDFIKQQVAPLIEKNFRGLPNDRVLSGSSLGGLFALTAAYTPDNFFSGYIAISPAAEWDNHALLKLDESYAQKNKSLNGRIFVSYGTKEYVAFREPIIQFQKQVAARKYQGLALQNYAMEGLDHSGVKGDGYVRGLMWVWLPKKPAGPSGLERIFTGAK
jgi:predicted alpha/beta superfamily hydrolase